MQIQVADQSPVYPADCSNQACANPLGKTKCLSALGYWRCQVCGNGVFMPNVLPAAGTPDFPFPRADAEIYCSQVRLASESAEYAQVLTPAGPVDFVPLGATDWVKTAAEERVREFVMNYLMKQEGFPFAAQRQRAYLQEKIAMIQTASQDAGEPQVRQVFFRLLGPHVVEIFLEAQTKFSLVGDQYSATISFFRVE